jgi:DNA-binding XRE family transcriptional regulator
MLKSKRKALEAAGFKIGSTSEFLGLSPAEERLVELRLLLSKAVRQLREECQLTQNELGKLLKSSQSRVAKIEAADPSVSLDLMFRSFFAAGGKMDDVKIRRPARNGEQKDVTKPTKSVSKRAIRGR